MNSEATTKIAWGWYSLTPNEWTAFSAVATLGAMVVAIVAVIATGAAVWASIRIPQKVANQAKEDAKAVDKARKDEEQKKADAAAKAEEAAIAMRYREVANAVSEALDLLRETVSRVQAAYDPTIPVRGATADFRKETNRFGAQAAYKSGTLDILARMPGLTDGAIDSCVGASIAMQRIVSAVQKGFFSGGTGPENLQAALVIGHEVKGRIEGVILYNDVKDAGPVSPLPPTLF